MKGYRRLLRFAKPYYGLLVISGIFMGIVTIFDVFRLSMIIPVIDRVFTNKQITFSGDKLPLFLKNIFSHLNELEPSKVLYALLIVMPVALLLRALFEFWHSYIMSDVGQRVIRDIRNLIYEKLQGLSLDFYIHKRSGELISRITNDVKLIDNAVSYALTDLIYQSAEFVFYTLMLFMINWKMAALFMGVPLLIAIPMSIVGRKLRKLSKGSQERMADINSLLVETFTGIRIVWAFCMEGKEIAKFRQQNQTFYRISMKSVKNALILGIATELVGVFAALFIMYYTGRQVIDGRLSFGVFSLFMAGLLSLIKPIKKLSHVNSIVQQAMAASIRIYDILDARPSVVEKANATEFKGFRNNVVFDNVSFGYGAHEVLKDIDLEVKSGQILAIVGSSGAGKTTLVDLVPRFYDSRKGRILIDGIDIKDVTLKSLRYQIGIVSQETILFNDSISGNIAYGKPDAPRQEIEKAAGQAHAHEFIQRMKSGYDTFIGDRGARLSGGERQRIAIARALLKNPPILILDEATSQLDSESERLVQEALERLMQGRTVFVIAHRLSTVRNAHRIIVLDKGRIAESGSHAELLDKDSIYKKLYQLQEMEG